MSNWHYPYIRSIDEPLEEKLRKRNASEDEGIHKSQTGSSEQESMPDTDRQVSFQARNPLYEMESLVFPRQTITQLNTLKARFAHHSLVYDTWGVGKIDPSGRHIAFNLYGPSGTGKTSCVEALAREWGKKIIDVNYAEIESKYVGETGKNITAAFKAASDQDALLFFDEADSILGARMSQVTQSADQAVNVSRAVMLKQLDAFVGIVAFATNLAKNFDSAFVRRIPIHIEISLPDEQGRIKILKRLLPAELPFKQKVNCEALAKDTKGFSGGDLKNGVVNGLCAIADMNWQEMSMVDLMNVFSEQMRLVSRAKRDVGHSINVVTEEVVDRKDVVA